MARELGIETLCEGVETEEQADFLKGIGCSKLQGYLYSKPMPYDEIVRLYRNGSHFGYEELSNCAEELQK
jgi:EAL domain-containing protein (putative c-di-GMP-specific phosphodiesterase class I)